MYGSFKYLRWIMLGVFAAACAGLWGYQILVVWPRERCEAVGHWWDDKDRVCAIPMPLTTWTGRPLHPAPTAAQKPAAKP
jgi:hypothetical protein